MMTSRITMYHLEDAVRRINGELVGYTTANPNDLPPEKRVGCCYLQGAYGGWTLERIVNESGGCSHVFGCGYVSKRDLYNRMHAMLDGMKAWREADAKRHEDAKSARERMDAFLNREREDA